MALVSFALLGLSIAFLKAGPSHGKSRIDYPGAFLLMGTISFFLLYFTEGSSIGWYLSENLGFLVLGIMLFATFLTIERKKSEPLLRLELLRLRNVLVANVVTIFSGLVNFVVFFALVFYAELPPPAGIGLNEISTGLTLAPATLMMFVVGPLVGKLLPKVGPKPVLLSGSAFMRCARSF